MYVSVFIDMERSAQLQSYYSQCHKVTPGHYINHSYQVELTDVHNLKVLFVPYKDSSRGGAFYPS